MTVEDLIDKYRKMVTELEAEGESGDDINDAENATMIDDYKEFIGDLENLKFSMYRCLGK